ncbi:response regulator receiver domain-containing protein [Paraburkholderia sp. BL9I2N2]|nr:response regulator receiver domain-containing protein [Paraburkholderia sp. BL9I2N2]
MVSVEDTGIGIPADELPHLFDLFVQVDPMTRRSRSGLGIGLSVARSVVELHEGAISAISAGPGEGSRFTVRLPIAAALPTNKADPIAGPELPGPKLQILIIDDNRDAAESLALVLRMNDYEVRSADDGPSGVRVALTWSPDVILLDIGLPGMSGHDVARQLQGARLTRPPVLIALTGFGAEEGLRPKEADFPVRREHPA